MVHSIQFEFPDKSFIRLGGRADLPVGKLDMSILFTPESYVQTPLSDQIEHLLKERKGAPLNTQDTLPQTDPPTKLTTSDVATNPIANPLNQQSTRAKLVRGTSISRVVIPTRSESVNQQATNLKRPLIEEATQKRMKVGPPETKLSASDIEKRLLEKCKQLKEENDSLKMKLVLFQTIVKDANKLHKLQEILKLQEVY